MLVVFDWVSTSVQELHVQKAAAAEGNHFQALPNIMERIQSSVHREEIEKARFQKITVKSRIAIFLMQRNMIRSAFYFLYLCKEIKRIRKRG